MRTLLIALMMTLATQAGANNALPNFYGSGCFNNFLDGHRCFNFNLTNPILNSGMPEPQKPRMGKKAEALK